MATSQKVALTSKSARVGTKIRKIYPLLKCVNVHFTRIRGNLKFMGLLSYFNTQSNMYKHLEQVISQWVVTEMRKAMNTVVPDLPYNHNRAEGNLIFVHHTKVFALSTETKLSLNGLPKKE